MELNPDQYDELLKLALGEDIGPGDVTCEAVVPADVRGEGAFVCKQDGVVAGLPLAARVFTLLEPQAVFESFIEDGRKVREGQRLASVTARAQTIMAGRRRHVGEASCTIVSRTANGRSPVWISGHPSGRP